MIFSYTVIVANNVTIVALTYMISTELATGVNQNKIISASIVVLCLTL